MAFYNLSGKPSEMMAIWQELGISGTHTVRDLWREKDLGQHDGEFTMTVAPQRRTRENFTVKRMEK